MNGRYLLNDDGSIVEEPDLMKWAKSFEDDSHRRIGDDRIGDSRVSTVFLGLDHSFGCGAPIVFETMVFGGPLDGEQERYCTKTEAIAGHEDMVSRVRAAADAFSKEKDR